MYRYKDTRYVQGAESAVLNGTPPSVGGEMDDSLTAWLMVREDLTGRLNNHEDLKYHYGKLCQDTLLGYYSSCIFGKVARGNSEHRVILNTCSTNECRNKTTERMATALYF